MKVRLGFAGMISTANILDDLNFAIENGFNCFEISLDWPQNFELSSSTIKTIKNLSRDNDIFLTIHTPWYLPTASILPDLRRGALKVVEKGMKLASALGSDRIVVHHGFRELPKKYVEKNYEALKEFLKQVVSLGKKYDVMVGLENSNKHSLFLLHQPEKMIEILNEVTGLKAVFDAGHALSLIHI